MTNLVRDLYTRLVVKFVDQHLHAIDTGLHDWYAHANTGEVHAHFMLDTEQDIITTAAKLRNELDCNVTVDSIQYNVHYVLTPKVD